MTTPHDARPDVAALLTDARAAGPAPAFAPGFADRVAERIARDAAAGDAPIVLPTHVRRLVPLVAAASLVLAATNWWSARDRGESPLAAAIGLPSVTVADALTVTATDVPGAP